MSRVALDTNILLYAEGLRSVADDDRKIERSKNLLDKLYIERTEVYIPAQALAELHNALHRKLLLGHDEAAERILRLMRFYDTAPTDQHVIRAACMLAAAHKLQTFDAVILATAAMVDCDMLYSEAMQHGFTWEGVTVINPFA